MKRLMLMVPIVACSGHSNTEWRGDTETIESALDGSEIVAQGRDEADGISLVVATSIDMLDGMLDDVDGGTADMINCGWDRCGDSGGYVCTWPGGMCVLSRKNWTIRCAFHYCLKPIDSYPPINSCYDCKRDGYGRKAQDGPRQTALPTEAL